MCTTHKARHYRVMAEELPFFKMRHSGPFGRHGGPGPAGPGPAGFGPAGFGPGGFGFGPGFGGPGGRGRRRRGDVRTALLLLLAEEPRNGYQLMQTLEERTEGRWRPSPGSVYPSLSQLEDEGLIRSVQSDSGRTFEITDAGRAQLAERGEQKPPWEADEDDKRDSRRTLKHALAGAAAAAWQVAQAGDEQQIARANELLSETRSALYRLLAGDTDV